MPRPQPDVASASGDGLPPDIDARSINRRAAAGYDDLLYDPNPPKPGFAGDLFGIGALYGCAAPMGDLLDLGCGTGRYLQAIGSEMTGRAFGVDISAANVGAARALCLSLGTRAEVLQADFLDLAPEALGQFDLITNVGVHYVVPRDVRRHLATLMGACLRPGGLLLVSYYTGPMALARTALYRLIQARVDPDAPAQARVDAGRSILRALEKAPPNLPHKAVLDSCVRSLSGLKDATFFHEVFNPCFEVLDSYGLAEELRPHGLRFLNFVQASTLNGLGGSDERVAAAAGLDVLSGGYRFALFGKTGAADALFDIRAPKVRWRLMSKHRPDLSRKGVSVYDATGGEKQKIEIAYEFADFALRQMGEAGATLAEIRDAGARRLPKFDTPADATRLEDNLLMLWRLGAIAPMRDP